MVRKDRIQLEVEINGRKAGQTFGELVKQGRDLRRELNGLVPGTEAFINKSKELREVNDRLAGVRAQTRGVTTGLNQMRIAGAKVPGSISKIGLAFKTALNATGILFLVNTIIEAFRVFGRFGKESLDLFDQQAKADAQLRATIQSTAGIAGKEFEELKRQAADLQDLTLFGDETIQGAQALLLTFTNVREEIFDRATPAILDMATALGTDLDSASLQVGKALNDPVKGITSLSRAGVQFTDDQKAMIKSLVDAGESAKAQEIILGELETQFKGSAQAAAEAGTGGLTQMRNTFNDIRESVGALINRGFKAITPVLNILLTGFKRYVNFLLTIPAIFAGVRASITQFVDNAKANLESLVLTAEIAAKRLQLGITIRSGARQQLRNEIADLEEERETARAAGQSIGEAFAEAYEERINQVEDFSASASSNTQDAPSPTPVTNTTVNETVTKTTEEKTTIVTTEQRIKVDLAAAKAELERQRLLLEADRLENRISEEEYQAELNTLQEEFYNDSIAIYQNYGKDQSNEVLKLNNQLLKLNATTFAERKSLLDRELESENLLIQNKLTNNEITEVQAERLRLETRRLHLTELLDLLRQNGEDTGVEAQKVRNELDEIAQNPVMFTLTANGEFVGRDINDIIDQNLQLDLDQTDLDDQLRQRYDNALIAETEYQQSLRELQLESLDNEIAFQESRAEVDAELLTALFAKRREISDEYYATEAATRDREFQNFQTGVSATSDILSGITEAFQASYDQRVQALEAFEQTREGQTEAGKKRAEEERRALDRQKEQLKQIEILNIQINLAAELSSIARGAATLGPIAGPIIGGLQATAAILKAGNAIRTIQSKAEGGAISDNAPTPGESVNTIPVFRKRRLPRLSGERIAVPQNIAGTQSGDNVLALVKRGEVVLNPQQQADLASRAGTTPAGLFRSINVPGFMDGGLVSTANTTPRLSTQELSQLSGDSDTSTLERKFDEMIEKLDQFPKNLRAFVSLDDLEETQEEMDEIRARAVS